MIQYIREGSLKAQVKPFPNLETPGDACIDVDQPGALQDTDSCIPDSSRTEWGWSERSEVPLGAGGDIAVWISDLVWPRSDAASSHDVGVRLIRSGADGGCEPLSGLDKSDRVHTPTAQCLVDILILGLPGPTWTKR